MANQNKENQEEKQALVDRLEANAATVRELTEDWEQRDQLQQDKIRELTQQLQDATQNRHAVRDELHEGVPPAPELRSGHSPWLAMDADSMASISSATELENQRLRERMDQMKEQLEHAELYAQTREKQYVSPSDTL